MRRGIVLFMTLAILLTLSTVVLLFLRQSDAIKRSVRENRTTVQTNLILNDMSGYLKAQSFSQDDVYYGAGIPVALELGLIQGTLAIDSAQRTINLNLFLKALEKEQAVLEGFLNWMSDKKYKDPQLLLALLLDTLDTDAYPRERGSEIRQERPWFQNGSIPNDASLGTILHTYRLLSNDTRPTLSEWREIFGYDGATIDLNYATLDQLRLLFPDDPPETLQKIADHGDRYAKPEDLPVDEVERTRYLQPHAGITPSLATYDIAVAIDFTTGSECSGRIRFLMGLKKKKITRLSLSALHCP